MISNKDTQKLQNERHQLILQELLRDEDNKYCVDCDAKGPRWASWNIGIFLCIRCAGIHRNLGVHISKVKSVNLDSWTAAQLANMRDMGNSRARAIYEARLPDSFRRPQTDSALETFIRAKYEHKRYIAENYVPVQPDVDSLLKLLHQLEQSGKKRYASNCVNIGRLPQNTVDTNIPSPAQPGLQSQTPAVAVDLLGLNTDSQQNTGEDGSAQSGRQIHQQQHQQQQHQFAGSNAGDIFLTLSDRQQHNPPGPTASQITPSNGASSLSSDLLGLDLMGSSTNSPTPVCLPTAFSSSPSSEQPTKSTKDSILALYAQSSPQSFGNSANVLASSGWPMTNAAPAGSFVAPPNKDFSAPMIPYNQFGVFHQATPTAQPMNINQVYRPQAGLPNHTPAAWNSAYGSSNKQPPMSSGFMAPVQQVSHETYLSQVNSQLAALQLGGAANHHT